MKMGRDTYQDERRKHKDFAWRGLRVVGGNDKRRGTLEDNT